jgi:hypothetical protein
MILGAGEVLMDDVDVHAGTNGPNIVLNPTFNNGLTSWVIQGNHVRSILEPTGRTTKPIHAHPSERGRR